MFPLAARPPLQHTQTHTHAHTLLRLQRLVSSFHLWRCCQSAWETPGFPFHLEERGEMRGKAGSQRSVLMNSEQLWRGSADTRGRAAGRQDAGVCSCEAALIKGVAVITRTHKRAEHCVGIQLLTWAVNIRVLRTYLLKRITERCCAVCQQSSNRSY